MEAVMEAERYKEPWAGAGFFVFFLWFAVVWILIICRQKSHFLKIGGLAFNHL